MEEKDKEVYSCLSCERKIPREEYETYGGLCQECYELEIAELDLEDK